MCSGLGSVLFSWITCQPAIAETFLPEQDISLSGTVVVPSCKIRTDTDHLTFSKNKLADKVSQRLSLYLSQCDIEGINILFRAATWPGYPDRGILKSRNTQRPSPTWHFRVAPAPEQKAEPSGSALRVLSLATQPSGLVKDTPIKRVNPEGKYFNLNNAVYEYSVHIPQGQSELVIPFVVSLHHTSVAGHLVDDDLETTFGLQLTYK